MAARTAWYASLVGVATLFAGAMWSLRPAHADFVGQTETFSFTCGLGVATCGLPSFGTVTVTVEAIGVGKETLDFAIKLNSGYQLVSGGKITFGVNLTGISGATISDFPTGWTTTPSG